MLGSEADSWPAITQNLKPTKCTVEFVKPAVTQSKEPPAAHEDDFGRVLGLALSSSKETSVDSDMRTSDDAGEMRKTRKAGAPLKVRTGDSYVFGLASYT